MATLAIRLLGPFHVDLDGEALTNFKTDKVRGLLAYLAVEGSRPQQREKLAGTFWPNHPERRARANLSQALFMLRQSLGDDTAVSPFLLSRRHTIQLNPDSDLWLDVRVFTDCVKANNQTVSRAKIGELETAVSLYRGEFLEGFSLNGSSPFELWCLSVGENLHRLMSKTLTLLVDIYERETEYEKALLYAQRLLALNSWHEEAHTAVMRLLALCGRRSEALAQYDSCRRILQENLGIAPMPQTTSLYEALRSGQFRKEDLPEASILKLVPAAPSFLSTAAAPPPPHICVGRQSQLAWLNQLLARVLAGNGQVVFVTGEAGAGKTVLIEEFARQAMAQYAGLLVAKGKGTAYTGLGDPYAAFREIVSQLTGNVASRWAAGTISQIEALRLWRALPLAVHTLVHNAPDLVGTLVNGANLLEQATHFVQESHLGGVQTAWLAQLETLTARKVGGGGLMSTFQNVLFEQVMRLLTALALHAPLLLILDDLQWADLGTIALLFHISRHLSGQPILLLGAFRPEEVALVQDGQRHPLAPVVHEIQRDWGDILLELGQTTDAAFVEALVNSEPNRLDAAFRARLLRQTGGHPLYTAELLRGLQERGDLLLDSDGRWAAGTALDWETLPPRVEGVIAERVGRIPPEMQRLLQAASVQGEQFVAEVAAQALQSDEDEALLALGTVLSRDHRLVRAQSFERTRDGQKRLSVYQFHHFLFQKYLYNSLDHVARAHLHEATGAAMLQQFGTQTAEIAVQLARHFEQAKIMDKAVHYRLQAGYYAIELAALDEAIGHFAKGLALLDSLPKGPERAGSELALQLGLGTGLQLKQGYGSARAQRAYCRARDLCRQAGDSPQLVAALWPLATYAAMTGDLSQAATLAERALNVAIRVEDPLFIAVAHHQVGWIDFHNGRYLESTQHQDEVIALYDRQYHEQMVRLFGHDFGVTSLGWSAWPLWHLGYPDKALQRCQEAITLAQSFDHPFSLMHAYTMAAMIYVLRGETDKAGELGERILTLAADHGYIMYTASAHYYLGARLLAQGRIAEGSASWRQSLAIYEAVGVTLYHRGTLFGLAELYARTGQFEPAYQTLAEIEAVGFTDYMDGSIEHLRGLLIHLQGQAPEEAEAYYQRAIRIARCRQAKLSELQVTMSLCRLWQGQGRQAAARERLAEVYNWFSEGFETADLRAAALLLKTSPA